MKRTKPHRCSCMKKIEQRQEKTQKRRVFILVMSSCLHGFRFQLSISPLLAVSCTQRIKLKRNFTLF